MSNIDIFKDVEIAVLTITPEETKAACKLLNASMSNDIEDDSQNITYYVGNTQLKLRSALVVIAQMNYMGNSNASNLSTHIISAFKNLKIICIAGMGGRLNSKLEIGDTVIADQILDLELVKETLGDSLLDSRAYPIDQSIIMRVNHLFSKSGDENVKFINHSKNKAFRVFSGPIGASNEVIMNQEYHKILKMKNFNRKVLAIDMESSGVSKAVSATKKDIKFICIRGISDFADPNKNDLENESKGKNRELASQNAIITLKNLLNEIDL